MTALGQGTYHHAHVAEAILRRDQIGCVAVVNATGERCRLTGYRMLPSGQAVQLDNERVLWIEDVTITEERA